MFQMWTTGSYQELKLVSLGTFTTPYLELPPSRTIPSVSAIVRYQCMASSLNTGLRNVQGKYMVQTSEAETLLRQETDGI